MHVIFVEPSFPANQREFARALRAVGAQVTGIGERPIEYLDNEMRGWLHAYEQVPSVVNEGALLEAVQRVQARGWVDRLEATIEAHIMPVARVREQCRIPGTSTRTAWLCRDKPSMKEALRAAGVPCARSTAAESGDEVRAFARMVGYPLILKPRSAAGASGTVRVDDDGSLERAIQEMQVDRGYSVAVEEFIEGHEAFYDTITVNGRIEHEFITHYYPGVLEAMRTRETPAYFVTTNRVGEPSYGEVKEMGKRVIEVLGIETSATHMEWFFGPKGLHFSEIGCRPPGVGAWDVYCLANEIDIYREWASAIVHGKTEGRLSRGYSAAMLSLRPDRDGTITAYEGVEEAMRRFGDSIMHTHFPPPGSPANPIEGGYMANAWMRLRHPDYDELRKICDTVGRMIKIRAR